MIINKTKSLVYAMLILAVGYVAGAFIGVPFVEDGLLMGDIGKARLYNNNNDKSEDTSAELMRTDSVYRGETVESIYLLGARIDAADSLVNATMKMAEGKKELADVKNDMEPVAEKAANAKETFRRLFCKTEDLLAGKDVEDYEQLLNNARLAFMTVDNGMDICPAVVQKLTEYGMAKNNADVKALAVQWMDYGAENAILSGDETAMQIWKEVYEGVRNSDNNSMGLREFPTLNSVLSKLQSSIQISAGSLKQTSRTLGQTSRTLGQTSRTLGQTSRTLGQTSTTLGALSALDRISGSMGLKQRCLGRRRFR